MFMLVAAALAAKASIDELICIKEPFILRSLTGSINSEAGEWPPDVPLNWISFRLFGPNKSQEVWKIKLDKNGRFKKKMPEGVYRFLIEVEGWDDAEGVIIIDKKADKKKTFTLTLGLS